ncbi:hypothetical protein BpHYR1_045197 [Brachionus plicatilis]|uniref:Uncharacterized protein n=1 Tax=Brachionus plicatilis TaxID=10195 RepID=A0A3M7R6D0_BRAPC|nr:hypothetical protein BpHYR1_045197 [Brachionus plicatilis]
MRRGMVNNLVYDGESGSFDEFEAAFKYDRIIYGWDDRKQNAAIELCLLGKAKKLGCVKSPEYHLNLFYSKQLKPDQKISDFCYEIEKLMDKALPNLDEDNRTRMLRSRLITTNYQLTKGYVIDAEIDVESDGSREANMIKCQNYFSTNTNTLNKLIRIESDVEFGGERFGLKLLADSGASASFISPDSLPKSLSKKIDVFLETGKQEKWLYWRKSNLTIKSAFNSETVKTAVGTVRLRFKDWEGYSENMVKIKLDCFKPRDKFVFEANARTVKDMAKGIIWGNCLNEVKDDGTILLSVIKTLNREVVIEKGSSIGDVYMADEEEKCEITIDINNARNEIFDLFNSCDIVNSESETSKKAIVDEFLKLNSEKVFNVQIEPNRLVEIINKLQNDKLSGYNSITNEKIKFGISGKLIMILKLIFETMINYNVVMKTFTIGVVKLLQKDQSKSLSDINFCSIKLCYYKTYIRPMLYYGIDNMVINKSQNKMLQTLESKLIKGMFRISKKSRSTALLRAINIETVEELTIKTKIKFANRLIKFEITKQLLEELDKNDPLAKIDKKSLMYELKCITKKETIQEILNQGNQIVSDNRVKRMRERKTDNVRQINEVLKYTGEKE